MVDCSAPTPEDEIIEAHPIKKEESTWQQAEKQKWAEHGMTGLLQLAKTALDQKSSSGFLSNSNQVRSEEEEDFYKTNLW